MDKPKFNFAQVGRSWNDTFQDTLRKATKAQMKLQALVKMDAPTIEAMDAIEERYDEVMATLDGIQQQQREMICSVLVGVPDAWLSADAPDAIDIDWSEPASLDYLQPGAYVEILGMVQSGEAYRIKSKN